MENELEKVTLSSLLADEHNCQALIIESEGEIEPDVELALLSNQQAVAKKIDSYSYIRKRLLAEAEFRKQEADAHKKIQKRCETAVEKMDQALLFLMKMHDKKEFLGNKTKFVHTVAGKPSLELKEDVKPEDLPPTLVRTKYEPNKDAAQALLKEGGQAIVEKYFNIVYKESAKEKPHVDKKLIDVK